MAVEGGVAVDDSLAGTDVGTEVGIGSPLALEVLTEHAQQRVAVKGRREENMKTGFFLVCLVALAAICWAEKKGGLQIGVKKRPETCDMRSKKGDKLSMHYTVSEMKHPCLFSWFCCIAVWSGPQYSCSVLCCAGYTRRWNRIRQ